MKDIVLHRFEFWFLLQSDTEEEGKVGTKAWKDYYVFANLQIVMDWSLMQEYLPHLELDLQPQVKQVSFSRITNAVTHWNAEHVQYVLCSHQAPWRHYTIDFGTLLASAFYPVLMLLVYITTVVIIVNTIVTEKELRLREGMLVMGLTTRTYWCTWFISHWSTLVISSSVNCLLGAPYNRESCAVLSAADYGND